MSLYDNAKQFLISIKGNAELIFSSFIIMRKYNWALKYKYSFKSDYIDPGLTKTLLLIEKSMLKDLIRVGISIIHLGTVSKTSAIYLMICIIQ